MGERSLAVGLKPWVTRTAPAGEWRHVCYGNGLFVAVGNVVMTSSDGINWTQSDINGVDFWYAICYGNDLFVAAVSINSYESYAVMTSPDGINWTISSVLSDDAGNLWYSVCYGNGLFVAVGNVVMTSPDGINWTIIDIPYNGGNTWYSVCYGNGLFVAVSYFNVDDTGHNVMTSSDGINWMLSSVLTENYWFSVCYGNGLFVAVGDAVMTSPDGINWTPQTIPPTGNVWFSVCYGDGLFVAVGGYDPSVSNGVMISVDGVSWTVMDAPVPDYYWFSVCYGDSLFVATTLPQSVESLSVMTAELILRNAGQIAIKLVATAKPHLLKTSSAVVEISSNIAGTAKRTFHRAVSVVLSMVAAAKGIRARRNKSNVTVTAILEATAKRKMFADGAINIVLNLIARLRQRYKRIYPKLDMMEYPVEMGCADYPLSVERADYPLEMEYVDYLLSVGRIEYKIIMEVFGMPFAGSTVTLKGTFPSSAGDLTQLDDVVCNVYFPGRTLAETITPTELSTGVYSADYTIPGDKTGQFDYEFSGELGGKTLVGRSSFDSLWK